MFNIEPFKLCNNKQPIHNYKYDYYATIEKLFTIKDNLEKQKGKNNKLKNKNKILKEENNYLHNLLNNSSKPIKIVKTDKKIEEDISQYIII